MTHWSIGRDDTNGTTLRGSGHYGTILTLLNPSEAAARVNMADDRLRFITKRISPFMNDTLLYQEQTRS